FTEPVTTHTSRFIKTFWGLDTKLAYSRHYPSINWITSYTGYVDDVSDWWSKNVYQNWRQLRLEAFEILQREDVLKEIVRLLGPEALPNEEKLLLDVARMVKEGFLQQSAFDDVDTYCSPEKQVKQLNILVEFYHLALSALGSGVPLEDIRAMPIITSIIRSKYEIPNTELDKLDKLLGKMKDSFKEIRKVKETETIVK
ncbi:MAG TPA: V-type ATP synthase subunit A, partial [Nitrososphaerales archaeon]|nr:V-type ATP synthase subunit A [Nitrososphaerales archaeon]